MKIASTELTVLHILWNESPLTIGQIIARVQPDTGWHENTIKTLVGRLFKKDLISRKKDGKQFFYSPLIEKNVVISDASESLLSRFFGGKLSPLVAHFAKAKKLSAKEIAEIEAILNEMKND
ncbi:MAG: BlaI/MecI/CopY family transcriptional regulator [Xanthomonadales bacterium]|nr:BlaI/MecI/CopY family transcriptional regulator [Xanthomonadales bacterium]